MNELRYGALLSRPDPPFVRAANRNALSIFPTGTTDIVLNGAATLGYTECYRNVGACVHGVAQITPTVFLDAHVLKHQAVYMAEYPKHLFAMD
ncbi:hypothetical protein D3C84_941320 [compost metagenome]